jgi:hypothetical protein
MSDVTHLLAAIDQGDPLAAAQMLPLVYDELRRLAAAQMAREKPGQTLDATALVHEAYLRLLGLADDQRWQNRGHFFAAAAEAMRRILVETARRKQRLRHGGGLRRSDLPADGPALTSPVEDVVAVHERGKSSPPRTRRRPSWSSCTTSPGLPSNRLPRCSGCRSEKPTPSGPMPAPGCSAAWGVKPHPRPDRARFPHSSPILTVVGLLAHAKVPRWRVGLLAHANGNKDPPSDCF